MKHLYAHAVLKVLLFLDFVWVRILSWIKWLRVAVCQSCFFWEIQTRIVSIISGLWLIRNMHIALYLTSILVSVSQMRCVAVCCSVLQYVAVFCSVLQCVAVCCSVLQCVAVCCSVWRPSLCWSHKCMRISKCACKCMHPNTPVHVCT